MGAPLTQAEESPNKDRVDPSEAMSLAMESVYVRGDVSTFQARLKSQLLSVEEQIADLCKKQRDMVEAAVKELIDTREALTCEEGNIQTAEQGLRDTLQACEEAGSEVRSSLRRKENAEEALKTLRRTRRMIHLCVRIELMITERRLHAAVKLVHMYREQRKSIPEGGFLTRILPEESVLEKEIQMHARRLLRSWNRSARNVVTKVGRYALMHSERAANFRAQNRAVWLPQMAEEGRGGLWKDNLSDGRRSMRSESNLNTGEDGPRTDVRSERPPRIPMRALLSSFLVYRDLGKEDELREEYQKERESDLEAGLSLVKSTTEVSAYEEAVTFVCGFFVIERTVARHSEHVNSMLLPRPAMNALWMRAEDLLGEMFHNCVQEHEGDARNDLQVIRDKLGDFSGHYQFPLRSLRLSIPPK